MGKEPIVSITYENERISIKNSLPCGAVDFKNNLPGAASISFNTVTTVSAVCNCSLSVLYLRLFRTFQLVIVKRSLVFNLRTAEKEWLQDLPAEACRSGKISIYHALLT